MSVLASFCHPLRADRSKVPISVEPVLPEYAKSMCTTVRHFISHRGFYSIKVAGVGASKTRDGSAVLCLAPPTTTYLAVSAR